MIPSQALTRLIRDTIMMTTIIGFSFSGCTVKVDPITVKTERMEEKGAAPISMGPIQQTITVNTDKMDEKSSSAAQASGAQPKDCSAGFKCDPTNKDECAQEPGACIVRQLIAGFTIGGVACSWGNQCAAPGQPCSGGKCQNTIIPGGGGGCMCACR